MSGQVVVTLLLVILFGISCMCISFKKITREREVKLNNVFYSLKMNTPIQCCILCREYSSCTAVNYSPEFKICELNNATLVKSDSQQHDVYYMEYTCESPWVLFGNHCYMFISTKRSWTQAETHCNGLNGNLVDIQSEDENTFVRNMVDTDGQSGKKFWIGMYVSPTNGDRSWTTGNQVDYQNFKTGEPDNASENCMVMLGSMQWDDGFCSFTKFSVCKRHAQ